MILKTIKKFNWLIIPLALIILIRVWASNPLWVEIYYSNGIYPLISRLQRILFGWLPFSAGDLLYISGGFFVIFFLVKTFRRYRFSWKAFGVITKKFILVLIWLYIVFNLAWGLNYYRTGFQSQLHISPDQYSADDLRNFVSALVPEINTARTHITDDERKDSSYKKIFAGAVNCYDKAEPQFKFLTYSSKSIKPSMFNTMGNYLGFLGYYNPFSGEAQVNSKAPSFVLPFTACHEIGHQLGYGSESEASFAAYLASLSSENNVFKYSAYFDLFLFANRELYMIDSGMAKQNFRQLDTLVKADIHAYRNYLEAYNNPVEPFITDMYSSYLKANNQPQGMESYDQVLAWVIAYRKKYAY